jgi:hypothetical protein
MKPVEFPEMNTKFVAPGCGDLPVHMDGKNIVSCWELTDEERQKIADGGNLWLMIVGMHQPPVLITTDFPIVDKTEWPEELEADH